MRCLKLKLLKITRVNSAVHEKLIIVMSCVNVRRTVCTM